MCKITEKYNYRVVIEPKGLGDYGAIRVSDSMFHKTQKEREIAYERKCNEMVAEVKRHVDGVRSVYVDFDTEEKCSHCGYRWEVDENGIPLCCEKAIKEYNSKLA